MISVDDLEKIMQIVDKYDVSSLEFKQGDSKVIINKNTGCEPVFNKRVEKAEKYENQTLDSGIGNDKVEEEKQYIKAAFAGTFYSSKEKGEAPFVQINDNVEQDTVVCLIEVMKLFNEVEAGVNGTIVDVFVKDGDFVEYGQPLYEMKINQ